MTYNNTCPICKRRMIKVIGSNLSCTNKNCENYVNDKYDQIFVDYDSYRDINDLDMNSLPDNVEKEYCEDYDKFLYFADFPNYISRFEYRKMNNFKEDHIFKGNKIARFKSYLDDEEIYDFDLVRDKYNLIFKGRDLEGKSYEEALKYYYSLFHNRLFRNDYYLYRKLVKLEKNHEKRLDLILSFFRSGIYCNRYNYLWFLKRLEQLTRKINVPFEDVKDALYEFKNNGFNKKKFEDDPVPLAEKIVCVSNELKVRTEEAYTLKQFRYELQEEAMNLRNVGQYRQGTEILERLVLYHGFKSSALFRDICKNYHYLGDHENELKWIYAYFNKTNKLKNNLNDTFFTNRLNQLNVQTNEWYHESLFFDTNNFYLTKDDFKKQSKESFEIWDYISLIKEKNSMVSKGMKLEKSNIRLAIDYYKSILNHELFKNDFYVYKTLVLLYDKIGDFESEIEAIISFFKSGIYCDRYNYLLFLFQLKKLSYEFIIYDNEINDCLKSFKHNSFKNRSLENFPAPLAERLVFKNNMLEIISGEEFQIQQEWAALDLEYQLFQSSSMFNSANDILKTMIDDYGMDDEESFKEICLNYQELNDVESEMKFINSILEGNKFSLKSKRWFEDRLNQLNDVESIPQPIREPSFEIFYETNQYYLGHQDFRSDKFTELIDLTMLKLQLRREGWRLEFNNPEKVENYYKSLLNLDIFKNDYYIYRRLVLHYDKYNEYESVWRTIKEFFYSGIYCNRYQYLWFLHKVANVAQVMNISDKEISDCLKSFKENGFKNKSMENSPAFLAERIYYNKFSLRIDSYRKYYKTQKKYELKEEAGQLELNNEKEVSVEILRNMVENGCETSAKIYMRLCHSYRRLDDYENELEIINMYLSKNTEFSRGWFEKRLNEVNELKGN